MKISDKKKEKILEQILLVLYESFPKLIFTSHIAEEIARDEEYVKKLLIELKNKKLITEVKKNPKGVDYKRRSRWTLTKKTYQAYKNI
ncbi:MAG: hypothetical protein ACOCUU_00520 [Nanoarchaeota archaeon]